jgi:hypothetical protein
MARTPFQLSPKSSKNIKKAGRKRGQDEATKSQEPSSSLPPSKKSKPNNPSMRDVSTEQQARHIKTTPTSNSLPVQDSSHGYAIAPELLDGLASYEIVDMNIISSSQIQSKVTRILETLSNFSFVAPTKPSIVMIHAKAPVASKLISIVEIAKREIQKVGGKWYQYSGLEQTIIQPGKQSAVMKGPGFTLGSKSEGATEAMDEEGESQSVDGETGFETMKTPLERALEGKPKIRAVPVMTIYLSRIGIDSLKKAFGFVSRSKS